MSAVLTDADIDAYARDGAVCVPGLFADWVDTITAGIERNMREPGPYASENLKPGEVVKEPLQTPLGFVILRLDAVTPYTPPPFDQVRDNLKRQAQKKGGEDQLAKIRADAKIVPAPGTTPAQPNTQLPQPPVQQPAPAKPAGEKPAGDATKPQN